MDVVNLVKMFDELYGLMQMTIDNILMSGHEEDIINSMSSHKRRCRFGHIN